MDLLDYAQKLGSEGAWALTSLFLAFSAYKGIVAMAPVWADRYRLHTQLLTAQDAKRAGEIVRKLNGRVYQDIVGYLVGDTTFRERFVMRHQLETVVEEQDRILALIDNHEREDRSVHDRVKGLEVHMDQVKENVREIKDDLKAAAKAVTDEAKAMREERNNGEREILKHIDELFRRGTRT